MINPNDIYTSLALPSRDGAEEAQINCNVSLRTKFLWSEENFALDLAGKIAEQIYNDPSLHAVFRWRSSSLEEKINCAVGLGEVFSASLTDAHPTHMGFCRFDDPSDALFLDLARMIVLDYGFHKTDLQEVIETIAHEAIHYRHDKMADKWLSLSDEFDPIIELLKEEADNYISPKTDYEAYRKQFCEELAFTVSRTLSEEVCRLIHENNPFSAPKSEKAARPQRSRSSKAAKTRAPN